MGGRPSRPAGTSWWATTPEVILEAWTTFPAAGLEARRCTVTARPRRIAQILDQQTDRLWARRDRSLTARRSMAWEMLSETSMTIGNRRRRHHGRQRRATSWRAGLPVEIFEASPTLGGWPVRWCSRMARRSTASIMPSCRATRTCRQLCAELGIDDQLRFRQTRMGFYHDGRIVLDELDPRVAALSAPGLDRPISARTDGAGGPVHP